MHLGTIILFAISVAIVVLVVRSIVVVKSTEAVVVERLGKFSRVLSPGRHTLAPVVDAIRARVSTAPTRQEVRVSEVVVRLDYRVADPVRATYEPTTSLADELRAIVEAAIGAHPSDPTPALRAALDAQAPRFGVTITGVDVQRDFGAGR